MEKKTQKHGQMIMAGLALATGIALSIPGFLFAESKTTSLRLSPEAQPIFLERWERYEGFVTEAELAEIPRKPSYIMARGETPFLRAPEPGAGPLSYRSRITLDAKGSERHYALYIPNIASYDAVFANGLPLYTRGEEPYPSRELRFKATGPEIAILLHSGRGGPRLEAPGAVPRFILLGGTRSLESFRSLATGFELSGIMALSFGGLLLLGLLIFERKSRDYLAFAYLLLSAGLLLFFKQAGIIGIFSPDSEPVERGYFAARILLASALCCYSIISYPKQNPLHTPLTGLARIPNPRTVALKASAILAVSMLAAAAMALPVPKRVLDLVSMSVLALAVLTAAAWILRAALRRDRGAPWKLAFLVLATASTIARRFAAGPWASFFIELPAYAAFSFAACFSLVRKSNEDLDMADSMTDYVSNVNLSLKRFIPKEFLDYLNKTDITDLQLGDHVKKEMTIFFSDIRAFTELSERLTVEENFAFINSYLSRMVPLITEGGGFIDKYIGDAIMALFPGESGPDSAIRTAISMQEKIVEYNGHRAKMGYRPISMGVGIHTGDLMLGIVGVSDRMESTVISDAVNLASRLQAITKAFNIGLVISEQSFKDLADPGSYKYRFIGKVKVKGKAAPVSVFEIFDGIEPDLFERKMKANTFFEQGMLTYYQKDFAGAMYYFKRVLDVIPEDGAAAFYLENCITKASL